MTFYFIFPIFSYKRLKEKFQTEIFGNKLLLFLKQKCLKICPVEQFSIALLYYNMQSSVKYFVLYVHN